MSTTFEPDAGITSSAASAGTDTQAAAHRIRHHFAACRVRFHWLGTTKTLSAEQKSQAAESLGAEGESISAGKKLINTRHDCYKALTSIKIAINAFWKDNSLPYPEPGIRLIKQDRIDVFNSTLEDFREQLEAGVRMLADHFGQIKSAAHFASVTCMIRPTIRRLWQVSST